MSKKSLKEQMEGKGQKKVRTTTRNWPLIITLIVLALLFILLIVIGIVAFHRAEKMSADTLNNLPDMSFSQDASTPDTNSYSMNGATPGMSGETGSNAPGLSSSYGSGSSFQYGTVNGTTYTSAFSGITFSAPANWTVKGGSELGQASDTAVMDLEAQNPDGSMNVKMEYVALNQQTYNSSAEVLAALKGGVKTSQDNINLSLAGHNFTGFLFKGQNGSQDAYSELLATEVGGYALIIQVIAPTSNDLTTILNMFS